MATVKNGHDKYVMVTAPSDFPGKRYHRGKYCYEHHLAYWMAHAIVPAKGEVVHHKDGDIRNNDPKNLELLLRAAHSAAHALERRAVLLATIPHGTLKGYRRGCRCPKCRGENARQGREYKWKVGLRVKGRSRGRPAKTVQG